VVDFTWACREHAAARMQSRSACRVEVGPTLLDYAHRALGPRADILQSAFFRSCHGGDAGEAASIDETDQRCLIVHSGALARALSLVSIPHSGLCFDISPARLAALAGVRGRCVEQNDLTASATAALTSA